MRVLRRLLLICLCIALALAGLTCRSLQVPAASGEHDGAWRNAAWVEHRWVGVPQTRTALVELCTVARLHAIDTLFVHVGPIDAAGRIAAGRVPEAARFSAAFHALCPGVRLLAWLNGMLPAWQGLLEPRDAPVRRSLAATAGWFVGQGFDGIQYDLEPVADGDPALLDLLRQTRVALHGARLALAGPALLPPAGMPALPHLRLPLPAWSAAYYGRVAALVDEIDPMLYVTSLRTAGDYSRFVADQAAALTRSLPGVVVRVGIPAFGDRSAVFDDRAENLRSACEGLRQAGVALHVALYPLWTMTAPLWSDYALCDTPPAG